MNEDKYFNTLPKEVKEGLNRVLWNWRYDTPDKYQHRVKVYYRMISGIDDEIGELRKVLEEKGFMDTNRKWNVLLSVFSSRRDGWNNYGSITADFYEPKNFMSRIAINPDFTRDIWVPITPFYLGVNPKNPT